jgi:ABC-type multidrug transport system ATPase subunit
MKDKKILELKNFSVEFENGKKIEYGDIEISYGERVGITGRSGFGKTTLLNALFGREKKQKISYEKAKLFGERIEKLKNNLYQRVSYLPQFSQDALDGEIKVSEYIDLVLKYNEEKFSVEDIRGLMGELQLKKEILKQKIKSLSGGERQRVVLLLSFLKGPELLVMDEPTSSVDIINLRSIMNFLEKYSSGMTLLIVSHNKNFLQRSCQRVIYVGD